MRKLGIVSKAAVLGLTLTAAAAATAGAARASHPNYPAPRPVPTRPADQRFHQLERTVQLLEQRVRALEYANGGNRIDTTCTISAARGGRAYSASGTDRYQAAEAARQQCLQYENYYDCQTEPVCRARY